MTAATRKASLVVGGALLGVMGALIAVTPARPSRAEEMADQIGSIDRANEELVQQIVGPPGPTGADGVTAEQVQHAIDSYLRQPPEEQP